jgi:hypothetical protein
MTTRKPSTRNRSIRPRAEDLEARELLSGTVSGTDIDGDSWTLHLIGPGSLVVTKQPAAGSTTPQPLASQSEIDTITIGGTDPTKSVLVGTVRKGANGDGKVFFQTFDQLASTSLGTTGGQGNGLVAVNMPNFWLGNTTPASSSTTTPTTPSITMPDGVDTLRFGGVDTTHNQVAATSSSTSDNTQVELGLPTYGGTRIIIDKSISSSQTAPATSGGTATTIQHAVSFEVSGRLQLFQANEIDGDANTPPGQFANNNTNATGFGGTWVVSGTAGTPPFFPTVNPFGVVLGGVPGQIGNLRVGGAATNLTALAFDATGTGSAKINNFSIGGETNNVMVVAPNGSRNLVFGTGMDTVTVLSHVINTIQANRGAVNSTVFSDRTISNISLGGDVVNSQFLSGYQQNFTNIINTIDGQATVSTFQPTPMPAAPPTPTSAQLGGGMIANIAGNVTDSVFAASVQPSAGLPAPTPPDTGFGSPFDAKLPTGHIKAKIEGTITNTNATPDSPNKAFYAKSVTVLTGPVVPPNVPMPPYSGAIQPRRAPGIPNLNAHHLTLNPGTAATLHGLATPTGPHAHAKKKAK